MVIQFGGHQPPRHHDRGRYYSSTPLNPVVGVIIALIVGAIFVAIGTWMLISDYNAKTSGEYVEVTGTITNVTHEWDDMDYEYTDTYYVTYTTLEGQSYEAAYPSSSSTYYLGKEVKVLYNIKNPLNIKTGGALTMIIGIVCVAIGGIIALALVISLVKGKSSKIGNQNDAFMSDNIGAKEQTKEDKVF